MYERQKQTLEKARAALTSGNLDLLLDCFAPGAVHKTLDVAGWVSTPRHHLKALLLERMAGRKEPVWLTDQRRVRVRNISAGDVVVSEGILTGKLKTGKLIAQPVLTIARFDSLGRINEERLYYDMVAARGGALTQMRPRNAVEAVPEVAQWHFAEGAPDETFNAKLVEALLACLCDGRVDQAAELVSDDVTYVDQSFGTEIHGKRAFLAALSDVRHRVRNLEVEPTGVWAAGAYVVTETTWTGGRGVARRVADARGRAPAVHCAMVFEIAGNRAVRCTLYRSIAELSAALQIPLHVEGE